MRDELARIIEDDMQQGLHLADARTLDKGVIEHARIPDLVAVLGFEPLVGLRSEQLAFGEAALAEKR